MNLQIKTPRWSLPIVDAAGARYLGAHGGRGCLHPDALIDTPQGQVKVSEFQGGDVYSWHQGRIVIAQATPSAEFTEEDLFEVVLDDGRSIIATDQHKFLTPDGWRQLSSLDTVASVLSARQKFDAYRHRSTSDTCLSGSRADALRCSQTHADCRGDCSECRRRCGQPPQWAADSAPAFALSPSDARQHSFRALSRWDDLERADRCNLSSFSRRRSTWAALASSALRYCAGWGSCIGERISEWPSAFCLPPALSPQMSFHLAQGPVSLARVLGLGILRNQVESPQMLHGISGRDVRNSFPSCDAFRGCGDFKVSKVESIRKHSRLKYWDLHVFGTNNYLSDGIVNHNSGKSHLFAEMLIERSIMGKVDAVCVREVQKSLAQSVKKLLENKINELGVSHMFTIKEFEIRSVHGGIIIFQGLQNHTADSIKSLEGYDIAWVEEAQSVSQFSLDILRPTIRKPGSQLWFTWNPRYDTDPIESLLRGPEPPNNTIVVEVNYQDNPWFPVELHDEMEYDKSRDPDKYMHVWKGDYVRNSETRVFKNWTAEDFETPPDAIHRLGADWGFASDPTVGIRCHIVGRKLYIDYEAYQVGCEIVDTPSLLMSIPEAEKWPMVADSARPETISHMRKNGFPKIQSAVKGAKSVEEGVEWLKSFDIIVHPRCQHTIDELMLYSYKTDRSTGSILPMLEDKDNHVIDALRYACEGARRASTQKKPKANPIATIMPIAR
jgi:phage terminase large subunit